MPKRICWVSQHSMNGVQMGALKRMFGEDVKVFEDHRVWNSAETIVRRIREGGYNDCIVVAPYSVLARLCDLGLRPLYSEAETVTDPKLCDWRVKDRMYRFLGFKRVKRMVLELEDLGTDAQRQNTD
ncbi:MAG: hypothetical protein Q8P11_03565 [bacterium]|nr:hypothetical protein [bacterium]